MSTDNGYIVKSNLPYYIWKIANFLYKSHIPLIPFCLQQFLRFTFCCFIPYQTKIGYSVHFGHNGMGIVLHENCVVGNFVWIDQHVTIGGRKGKIVPSIGNNVRIGAGAKVLGDVTIGDNVNIGANAVVLSDIPSGATAVGVPAKIKSNKR